MSDKTNTLIAARERKRVVYEDLSALLEEEQLGDIGGAEGPGARGPGVQVETREDERAGERLTGSEDAEVEEMSAMGGDSGGEDRNVGGDLVGEDTGSGGGIGGGELEQADGTGSNSGKVASTGRRQRGREEELEIVKQAMVKRVEEEKVTLSVRVARRLRSELKRQAINREISVQVAVAEALEAWLDRP